LLAAAATAAVAGFFAWFELRARARRLPSGTPDGTRVAATTTASTPAAPPLPATLTTARVDWVPVAANEPVTQGATFAFCDAAPAGATAEHLLATLQASGWSNAVVDALPGEVLPAWLPVKSGADVSGLFAARGTWSLMSAPPTRPRTIVAHRPQTPAAVKQSQASTSVVGAASVAVYTVTDGTWWWGSFACVAAGNRPIHPQAVGYTSAECVVKLQPLLAHCAAQAASPWPPLVAG
jgi:hypothetical protein